MYKFLFVKSNWWKIWHYLNECQWKILKINLENFIWFSNNVDGNLSCRLVLLWYHFSVQSAYLKKVNSLLTNQLRYFRWIPGINKLSEPAHYTSPRLELDGVTTAAGHLVYRRTRHLGEARPRLVKVL